MISDQVVQIAEFATIALMAAEQLRIKTKPLETFWLEPEQRDVLLLIPSLSKTIKNKLMKQKPVTVAEVASMTMSLAVDLPDGELQNQVALLMVAGHLMDQLEEGIMAKAEQLENLEAESSPKANPDILYQLKITLLGIEPPIWRRIQVQDCTLDRLHEHSRPQWAGITCTCTSSKLRGNGTVTPIFWTMVSEIFIASTRQPRCSVKFSPRQRSGFPSSTNTTLVMAGNMKFCSKAVFRWRRTESTHSVWKANRPVPPEDIGGVWGYPEYLEALANPKHERHKEFMEWGGSFDPDKFDPKRATREMRKGLPDWRMM